MSETVPLWLGVADLVPGLDEIALPVTGILVGIAAMKMLAAQQKSQTLSKAAAKPRVKCDEDEDDDPCKEFRKGNGPGKYRGGAHGETKGPVGDGLESHHTPSKAAIKLGGAPSILGKAPNFYDAPAIQMDKTDHIQTASWSSEDDAVEYKKLQAKLVKEGKLKEAAEMDVADIKRIAKDAGNPTKYDQALKEMQAYVDCLQQQIDKNK